MKDERCNDKNKTNKNDEIYISLRYFNVINLYYLFNQRIFLFQKDQIILI